MFPLILFFFLAVPIVEIYLLIQVGQVIGAGWTILLVVLTAVIGVWLLRIQGLSTLTRAQRRLQENELPAREILEGMALVVAGAFLLTPGFFTDTLGFLLLFPPTRIWLASLVASRMVVSGSMHAHSLHGRANQGQPDHGDPLQGRPRQHHDGDVIDGVKYHRDDD
ncbi:MAG TPA: FxsA family protein [Gammaproteobacteria bacterium]|nr:FxsA family protein [Gammaproteobacteria bacterium]